MIAIRWLGGLPCEFCTKDGSCLTVTPKESALWEASPTREVSCEIMPTIKDSFRGDDIGLLVDPSTELARVYNEDGWVTLMEDGYSTRSDTSRFNEDTDWGRTVGAGWEMAKTIYDSIPVMEREGWAEGILRNPKYQAIVVLGNPEGLEDLLEEILAVFQLPVIKIE